MEETKLEQQKGTKRKAMTKKQLTDSTISKQGGVKSEQLNPEKVGDPLI